MSEAPAPDWAAVRRVLVVGCPGAGKTHLAKRLGVALCLPVHHLDDHYWQAGWTPTPGPAWTDVVTALSDGTAWIIDGNHAPTLARRLAGADVVVLVDPGPRACVAGYLARLARLRRTPIGDLPPYMRTATGGRKVAERPLAFLWLIITYRRRVLPGVLAAIGASATPLVRLAHRSEAIEFGGRVHARR